MEIDHPDLWIAAIGVLCFGSFLFGYIKGAAAVLNPEQEEGK